MDVMDVMLSVCFHLALDWIGFASLVFESAFVCIACLCLRLRFESWTCTYLQILQSFSLGDMPWFFLCQVCVKFCLLWVVDVDKGLASTMLHGCQWLESWLEPWAGSQRRHNALQSPASHRSLLSLCDVHFTSSNQFNQWRAMRLRSQNGWNLAFFGWNVLKLLEASGASKSAPSTVGPSAFGAWRIQQCML